MSTGRSPHAEVQRPPWWVWLIGGALSMLLAAEVSLAGGPIAGAVAVALLSVGLGAGLSAWSLRVSVSPDGLRAGRAHVPLDVIGALTPLSGEQLRLRAGRDADPAAHLALRPWSRSALEIEVSDPADPTPYLLVSSADPSRLAAAIGALRPAK